MKKLLIVAAVLAISIIPVLADEPMKFGFSESWKPFNWKENGGCKGILVDIADEAIRKRMGIPIQCLIYPWERVQHLVRGNALDALISNGPLRKEWSEHSNEILLHLKWAIYVKTGNPRLERIKKAQSLEELRPFEFIDYIGNGWARANLVDGHFDVYLVASPSKVFELAAQGRGDVAIIPAMIGEYYIKKLGLQGSLVELPPVNPPIPFHLVIGKRSHFTKILPQFDHVIKEMKEDGSLQAIIDRYTK